MVEEGLEPFVEFLQTLDQAVNETQKREAFIALAARGFGDSRFATELALSAESKVRFSQAGLVRRGSVDSFYENLIIEFENDLRKTGEHAREQLQAYVAGAWREDGSGDRPYVAVATDGANWEIFTPALEIGADEIAVESIDLQLTDSFSAESVDDAQQLSDFLNRLFFRSDLLPPTAENFARDFGLLSHSFLAGKRELLGKLRELGEDSELAVLRRAWSDSLQIAYGSVETDDETFVKHTYLAVLARILVWAALERRHLKKGELESVLNGQYFLGRRVMNLVEDDFFRWHRIPSDTDASGIWVALSRHLAGYDLAAIGEDVLKPLYEQLVDPTARHDLGEYYTPDWLATIMTSRLLKGWDWSSGVMPSVLDPASGSGTFIRAAIEEVRGSTRDIKPSDLLDKLLASIMGIDVHPLAVTVARATYMLAIKDLIRYRRRPFTIPIFLANSLSMPRLAYAPSLFGEEVALTVDDTHYMVPEEFVRNGRDFDDAIDDVMAVARSFGQSSGSLRDVPASLKNRIDTRLADYEQADELADVLGGVATHIAKLIRERRDSVYGFLLKNHYRPAMLRHTFDYVIGNPPWLTVADIKEAGYKQLVVSLAADLQIAPRSAGEQSHTELASIFLAQAISQFLLRRSDSDGQPRVAMVMPRSIFAATHHRLLRQGEYKATFNVVELWDLEGVAPLFNVPACVLFASLEKPKIGIPNPGLIVSGRLRQKDVRWSEARQALTPVKTKFELAYLGKRSAWRPVGKEHVADAPNLYADDFRQGAIIYPQRLFVVTADGPVERDIGSLLVRTDPVAAKTAKLLRRTRVDHVVESDSLFCTAAADHLLPYTPARDLWKVVLPVLTDPGDPDFGPVDSTALRESGRVETATWLDWAEARWEQVRKAGDKSPLHERLDYMGQLTAQASMQRYVVLYAAAGRRPVACVVDTRALPLPFVARDKTYWASFNRIEEADFVAAFLNSDHVAKRIEDWMTMGLFGPRDIHKRTLDVPWPRFNAKNGLHRKLAEISAELRSQAEAALIELPEMNVGRQRPFMRSRLSAAGLKAVEGMVRGISASVPPVMIEEES